QLALGLAPSPVPAFDNFFPGRNVEAVSALQSLATGRSAEHFVYLWGARGCGRSHLLQAAVAAASSRGIIARYVVAGKPLPVEDSGVRMLAVDDVEKLNAQSQLEFFHLYNALRDCQGAVLAAGNVAPARLQLRADLLTRLGWGLVFQVHALSDDDKRVALKRHAAARAFDLRDEIVEYLLRHLKRDLPSLMTVLEALDRYSLETKRPITLPLLRELLQSEGDGNENPPPGT
ncbi:MAG TPA: DnaA regulatory inactivator Hda, partial [Burkholderiales bacterium]|nr:DnaA regulatory inactivator Hda [Burkholderiales bacterium]